MIGKKKVLALIPARQGSKSIPEKNIMNLGGHPMLAYSIAAAKLSKYIDRVIVSTDSEKFAAVARSYGAETPFMRPKKYATDVASDKDYVNHALNFLKKRENYTPDLVVNLRPTSPLRSPRTIDAAIETIHRDRRATSLRSVQQSEHTGYKLCRKRGNYMHFFGGEDFKRNEEYHSYSRQYLPTTYLGNGHVDIILPATYHRTGTLYGRNIYLLVTRKIADIDELRDFHFAEELLGDKEFASVINYLKTKKNRVQLS